MILGLIGAAGPARSALRQAMALPEPPGDAPARLAFHRLRPPVEAVMLADIPAHRLPAALPGIDLPLLLLDSPRPCPAADEALRLTRLAGLTQGLVILSGNAPGPADRQTLRAGLSGSAFADSPLLTLHDLAPLWPLLDLLRPAPISEGPLRLPIDRVLTAPDGQALVTGRLTAGRIACGQMVTLSPCGTPMQVVSLHRNARAADHALPGDRVGLLLRGPARPERGDMLLDAALHAPMRRIDLRPVPGASLPALPPNGLPVRVTLHAQDRIGRLLPADSDGNLPLILDAPAAAFCGDMLFLAPLHGRPFAAAHVLGRTGQPHAPPALPAAPALHHALNAVPMLDPAAFLRDRGLDPAGAAQACTGLIRLSYAGHQAVLRPEVWQTLCQTVAARLERHHATFPQSPGIGQAALRADLPGLPPPPLLEVLLHGMAQAGTLLRNPGGTLRRPWFHALRPHLDAAQMMQALPGLLGGKTCFNPPRLRDLAHALAQPEPLLRRLLRDAAQRGALVEVATDHFYLPATVEELRRLLAQLAAQNPDQPVSAATFRDALGTGRKIAIQILEHLDRSGLTLRSGPGRLPLAPPLPPCRSHP